MQATAAFITVQATLSWFVDNYPRFADWSASVRRISTFRDAIDDLIERGECEAAASLLAGSIASGRAAVAMIGHRARFSRANKS
jgi:putative ATP-binding cassette transporter